VGDKIESASKSHKDFMNLKCWSNKLTRKGERRISAVDEVKAQFPLPELTARVDG